MYNNSGLKLARFHSGPTAVHGRGTKTNMGSTSCGLRREILLVRGTCTDPDLFLGLKEIVISCNEG